MKIKSRIGAEILKRNSCRVPIGDHPPYNQKFFASFFQKRRPSFSAAPPTTSSRCHAR
jgi:hypothetical protein